MADPSSYRPAPGSIPTEPGVYRFLDELGRVIYVGKAKSLRSRLSSYFGDEWGLHPRTRTMVTTAARVEWTVVATEVEALQLEYAWIKEFDPRFNVRYRDDKSYPWLAVSVDEEFPRAMVIRGAKRRGLRYFGPYAHAWAIRETLDSLLRVFPVRSCSAGVFRRAAQTGRPCLLGYIGKCAAPCVGRIDEEAHRALVTGLCEVLAGSPVPTQRRLEREMRAAAATQEYERAARLRDDLRALERAMERQAVVLPDDADADVIAVAEDPLECAVQVFYVRGGRVRGQRGFVVERDDGAEAGDVVADFLGRAFAPDSADLAEAAVGGSAGGRPGPRLGRAGPDAPRRRRATNDGPDVPREIIASALPADDEVRALADWLTGLRGSRVTLRVPQRGEKRALLDTVQRNAEQSLATHKLRRAGDLTARSRALEELQEALDLPAAPLRIECIDVSNLAGSDVVASLVVFEDGVPRKSEYKRYALRTVGRPEPGSAGARAAAGSGGDGAGDVEGTGDDVAAVHEVVTRRFRRYLDERAEIGELEIGMVPEQEESAAPPTMIDPTTGRPRSFAYAPNLLVVDGGAPQVAAAARALADLGVDDVALCGLAKRLEEVWLPGEPDPVVLPRTSEALYLLQRVRDEAHRFAITYHRQKRSKRVRGSALDDIPGVGATRRAALLGAFGSVARLREAGVEEIAAVPGVGPAIAAAVVAALTGQAPAPAPGAAVGPAGQAGPARRSRGPAIPAGVDPVTGEILSTPGEPGGPDPALRPDSPSPPAPHSGGRATSGVATSGVGERSQASDAGHSEPPPPGVVAAPDEAPPHVGGAA